MRNISILLLFVLNIPSGVFGTKAGDKIAGYAKIKFVDNNYVHSKTYIGKLLKGDIQTLKYELLNSDAMSSDMVNENKSPEFKDSPDPYSIKIAGKKWKNKNTDAKNDLIGNFNVTDEESLQKVKEKKRIKDNQRISKNKKSENFFKNQNVKDMPHPNSYLSKHYRISGCRIFNGQTFKKQAGYVCLIIEYKIREGNYLNTYINIVEDNLKADSNYNLKYHGVGSKRKYYLEYVPSI
jgi:hypothetical protein